MSSRQDIFCLETPDIFQKRFRQILKGINFHFATQFLKAIIYGIYSEVWGTHKGYEYVQTEKLFSKFWKEGVMREKVFFWDIFKRAIDCQLMKGFIRDNPLYKNMKFKRTFFFTSPTTNSFFSCFVSPITLSRI